MKLYKEQLKNVKNKLFVAPMKLGAEQKEVRAIIDTGAIGTIIPLTSVKKHGLLGEAILFSK